MTERTITNWRLIDGEKLDNLPANVNESLALKEDKSEKWQANWYAELDWTWKVPVDQLPASASWVDSVNGKSWIVLLDTDDIPEWDNKYFSNNLVWAATNITGLVSWWELTVNAWDNTLLDVSAAVYYIQWVPYTYDWATWIANWLGTWETARRYWFDATWLVSQVSWYSDAQKQTILPIARINAVQWESWATASIQIPIDQRYFISEQGWRERKIRENVFLAQYTEAWWEFSESSTPLQVNQAAWVFYDAQSKEVIVTQEDNIKASYTYWDWWIPTVGAEATLVVNNTQYNNGTTLATMTDNYWKVDTLLKQSKDSNEFFVVLWDAEYATQTEAEAAWANFSFFQNESLSSLIEVARFLVRKNNTTINRIVNDIPRVKGNATTSTWVTPLLPTVSNPTELVTYEDAWRHFTSWAITHWGEITDLEDWTFDFAECEVAIRTSDSDEATLAVYKVAAAPWQTPADNEVTYYYIDYNSWNPIWASWTDIYSYNGTDKMQAYTIWRRWNSLFIVDALAQSVDWNRKWRRRDLEWDGNVQNGFWHSTGWSIITASWLNPILSAGKFFYSYSPITHIGFDTTVAWTANANVFDYYYDRASYTYIADSKAINNTQYDLNWVLTTFANNRFRADWVYVVLSSGTPRFVVIMWDAQYNTLAEAQLAPQPATLPAFMDWVGVLVWQTVAQQWISTLVTTTAFGSTFTPWASSSDHTLLSNLWWTGSWHTDWVNSVATFGAAWEATSTAISTFVRTTLNQTIAWIKTFSSFMITPSSAPTTDYQVANKKYVDDNAWGWSIEPIRIRIPWELIADTTTHQWVFWRNTSWATITISNVAFWVSIAAAWTWASAAFNIYKSSWTITDWIDTSAVNLFTSAVDLTTNNVDDTNVPDTATVEDGRWISLRNTASAWATNKAEDLECIITYS